MTACSRRVSILEGPLASNRRWLIVTLAALPPFHRNPPSRESQFFHFRADNYIKLKRELRIDDQIANKFDYSKYRWKVFRSIHTRVVIVPRQAEYTHLKRKTTVREENLDENTSLSIIPPKRRALGDEKSAEFRRISKVEEWINKWRVANPYEDYRSRATVENRWN